MADTDNTQAQKPSKWEGFKNGVSALTSAAWEHFDVTYQCGVAEAIGAIVGFVPDTLPVGIGYVKKAAIDSKTEIASPVQTATARTVKGLLGIDESNLSDAEKLACTSGEIIGSLVGTAGAVVVGSVLTAGLGTPASAARGTAAVAKTAEKTSNLLATFGKAANVGQKTYVAVGGFNGVAGVADVAYTLARSTPPSTPPVAAPPHYEVH